MSRKLKCSPGILIGTWVTIQCGKRLGMVGKVIDVAPATRNGATYHTYTLAITLDYGKRIEWVEYDDKDVQEIPRSFEIQNQY